MALTLPLRLTSGSRIGIGNSRNISFAFGSSIGSVQTRHSPTKLLMSSQSLTRIANPGWKSLEYSTDAKVKGVSLPEYRLLEVKEADGLRRIVMNDKKTRNALSLEMMKELISAVNASSPELRCVIITTPKDFPVFSSGHNLKQLTSENGIAAQKEIFATCTELMLAIRNAEVPVIAVVNGGLAAAAGCQLVAGCDFSVVSDKSHFSTPGANFGLFCSTPGIAVSRVANKSTSAFMVLTGQPITATEALNAGLVTKVVPEAEIDSTVDKIYFDIKSKSKAVISLGKKFFYQQLELPYQEALKQGEKIMVDNLQFKDGQEGLASFKEKRKPIWSHSTDKLV